MTVKISTKSGPAAKVLIASSISGFLAFVMWPDERDVFQAYVVCGIFAFAAVVGFLKVLSIFTQELDLRLNIAKSEHTTTDHGSAREASLQEIKSRGMTSPDGGMLLGFFLGQPIFSPEGTPFSITEMPPGVGKTSCYVFGSILHRAERGDSLLIIDLKLEIGPMLVPALLAMGIDVRCINPTHAYHDICGNVEINLFQMVLDAVYAEDERRSDAATYASNYAELIVPKNPNEKQPYFANGSRRIIVFAIIFLALTRPGQCTPSSVYALLTDTEELIFALREAHEFLDTGIPGDPLVAFQRLEAAELLHRAEKNEENFGSFLEGATQRLLAFNPSGRLRGYGEGAIHNIADMREKQVVYIVMAPLSHIRDFEVPVSLINENVLAACKANPAGHPVHIIADEALNYRFANLPSNLEVLRGLKVTAEFYIQSFSGLIRLYGKEDAQAIESYMDVKIYGGLVSYERAKFVSDMLSDTTIRKQDYSYKAKDTEEINVSSREISRKYQNPNEILNMERGKAWVFVRGMNPMCVDMVHFSQVKPWQRMVGEHPVNGKTPPAKIALSLDYPKRSNFS